MNGTEIIEYALCCVNLVIIMLVLGLLLSFLYSLLGGIRDVLQKD